MENNTLNKPLNSTEMTLKRYRIYGKHESKRRFAPMDLKKGCCVGNLIYASVLFEDEKDKLLPKLIAENSDWKFEARPVL